MHDLIQEMGWHIVHRSFPNSRLWQLQQIHDCVNGNKNLKAIEAIMLMDSEYHADDYDANLGLSADLFDRMKKLRLLDIDGKFTSTQPTLLPDELRWLCWNEYPFLFLPLADKCKLVGLEMARGSIKHLWHGRKILPNLKFIHLANLCSLIWFPDVSGAPNIERLILSFCLTLETVHKSLGSHKRLVYLDLNGCRNLTRFPSRLEMESLETLILSRCESLKRFPEVSPCMVKLSQINLYSCSGIQELPSSIGYLSSLSFLNLTDCSNLENIPNSVCELKYLKCLHLHNCMKLNYFPNNLGSMNMLEELRLGFAYNIGRPQSCIDFHSLTRLSSLRKLDLSWIQIEEESFPKNLDALASLEELYLSGNSELVQLPSIISHLSRVKLLELNECNRLESLCKLPSSIQVLKANDCVSLRKIGDLSTEGKWLYKIWLVNCHKLLEDEENQRYLDKMWQLSFIKKCATVNHRLSIAIPGSKIPSWIKQEKGGCRIGLKLPHKWYSNIMGFVVCGVFSWKFQSYDAYPTLTFKIVSDGKVFPRSEINYLMDATETAENGWSVWISYMPLGFFQQMYHDLQPEDWSYIEGNLDITVMLRNGTPSLRCGAHVICKEYFQQITSCITDYGIVVHVDDEDLGYDESISGNTYVYEEKFDEMSLMPLRSRTSKRRRIKHIRCGMRQKRSNPVRRIKKGPLKVSYDFEGLYDSVVR
ncbi:hypothetical protein L2E82_36109 [Cichorium intybus]|uniref:Uncharacterized protein n=1 Tax=Cichorium intybus TaxID=13427 RepID=A0ACB9BQK8_CICIN|nr:hypothetical protein L2E82_36109 [Cichorium intybus]